MQAISPKREALQDHAAPFRMPYQYIAVRKLIADLLVVLDHIATCFQRAVVSFKGILICSFLSPDLEVDRMYWAIEKAITYRLWLATLIA